MGLLGNVRNKLDKLVPRLRSQSDDRESVARGSSAESSVKAPGGSSAPLDCTSTKSKAKQSEFALQSSHEGFYDTDKQEKDKARSYSGQGAFGTEQRISRNPASSQSQDDQLARALGTRAATLHTATDAGAGSKLFEGDHGPLTPSDVGGALMYGSSSSQSGQPGSMSTNTSLDSRASPKQVSNPSSGRSSFVQERSSLDMLTKSMFDGTGFGGTEIVPEPLQEYLSALAVLPQDVPVPMTLLQRLWDLDSPFAAEGVTHQLERCGVMRTAQLDDGSTWALPSPMVLQFLWESEAGKLASQHKALLDGYTDNARISVMEIPNDGYILNAIGHHLVGAKQLTDLRQLLMDPAWLEQKLHAFGVASIVADYRRLLQVVQDSSVKLMLQALQMSMGACVAHPRVTMLWPQMLSRLAAVARNSELKDWYDRHCQRYVEYASGRVGRHLVHLLARSATLEQAGGLHRMTLRGHKGPVLKVLICPSGQDVITVSTDGTLQVWDMDIGDCVMQLGNGREAYTTAQVAPFGNLCIAGTESGACHVWDLANGTLRTTLVGHQGKVTALAVDQQGVRVVTASADRCARVWNLHTGRCEQVLVGHGGAVFTEVGMVCDVALSADGILAATASDDFSVKIWELDDQECLHTLQGHSGWVVSCKFIGSTYQIITGSHDHTARIWDAWKGQCLHVLEGHTGRINKVVVNGAGTRATTCSDDFTARVWDTGSGHCVSVLRGHGGWVNSAALTREGGHVVTVSGDHLGIVWNADTGACINALEGHSDDVWSITLTSRGRFAVTASQDATAKVWDLHADALMKPESHSGKVTVLAATPDGRLVMSSGSDCVLRCWDAASGRCLYSKKGHKTSVPWLACTSDGVMAITASGDRRVCVWQLSDGSCSAKLAEQLGSRVKSYAFDGAGRLAAVVLFDSTLSVWDLDSGECVSQIIKRAERDASRTHSSAVNAVYMSSDGCTAVTVSKDSTARIWDVASGTCRMVLSGHTDGIVAAALSADERMLVTVSFDTTARLWDLSTGTCTAVLSHPAGVASAMFSPDGQYLVTTSEPHTGWLWRVSDAMCISALPDHKGQISGLAFSPDSRFMATVSQDCTARVWRCETGALHAMFMADATLNCVVFAGHGDGENCLVLGDAGGRVHFLDFPLSLQA